MKNVIWIIGLLMSTFWGCADDENYFAETVSEDAISFVPAAGGAVMHYQLPKNSDVVAIRVRYRNAYGEEVLRNGSYACDTLMLSGFNEAQEDIPISISLCDRAGNESAPLRMKFSTKDSGPILFFKELKVTPSWEGFQISYNIPEEANGMAHIFYVGVNPATKQADTLLISSFYFDQGADTLVYKLQQKNTENTVVIRTEDVLAGRIVKQNEYEHVKSYNMEMLSPKEYDFKDPEDLTIEDELTKLSKDYLFDGDVWGTTSLGLPNTMFATYLAGPDAFDKPLFVIDLREARHLAEVRLYTILNIKRSFDGIFKRYYEEKLPCKVRIFVTNTEEDESSWVELGQFAQDAALEPTLRWCALVPSTWYWNEAASTVEELEARTPYYMSIQFPPEAESYRYLRVVVEETFDAINQKMWTNVDKYVTFHEFEIYTKKD